MVHREYLEKHPGITFALVDHITSPSAVVMPVKELAGVCRERGVKVMIDGAHSPGQIPLIVSEMGVDFFTGPLDNSPSTHEQREPTKSRL